MFLLLGNADETGEQLPIQLRNGQQFRSGAMTSAELQYVNALVAAFDAGVLQDVPDGTVLSTFIAKELNW